MRTISFACALVLIAGWFVATEAQRSDAASVKDMVARYIDPDTAEEDRASLRDELFWQPKRELARAIQGNLTNRETRESCLNLALELQVPGLFNLVRRYMSEAPKQVTAIGIRARDSSAMRHLLRDWRLAEDTNAVFAAMVEAFSNYPMDLDQLAEFRKVACDPTQSSVRVQACLDIIEAQIGKRADSAEALDAAYDGWVEEIRDDAQRTSQRGYDVMALQGWRKRGTRQLLGNHVIEDRGGMILNEPLGPGMRDPGYTVSVRIKVSEDVKASFILLMDQDGRRITYGVEASDGKVTQLLGQGDIKPATVKPGQWMELKWVVSQKADAPAGSRVLTLAVDGHTVNRGIVMSGSVVGMQIECSSGRLVVGNLEYIRN